MQLDVRDNIEHDTFDGRTLNEPKLTDKLTNKPK